MASADHRLKIEYDHNLSVHSPKDARVIIPLIFARYGTESVIDIGCGMGGCYSCVIPVRDGVNGHHYVRSCIGGPVFRGEDLVWD